MSLKTKVCSGCSKVRSYSEYYPNRARKNGISTQCKFCTKRRSDDWKKANLDKIMHGNKLRRHRHRRNNNVRYLIMIRLGSSRRLAKLRSYVACSATIDELVGKFTTTCQCCFKDVGYKIHLDHCHLTGKFRGFICGACNTVLGHANDSIVILKQAIDYLTRSRDP